MCRCPHFTDEKSCTQCLSDFIKVAQDKKFSRDGCRIQEGLTLFLSELIKKKEEAEEWHQKEKNAKLMLDNRISTVV